MGGTHSDKGVAARDALHWLISVTHQQARGLNLLQRALLAACAKPSTRIWLADFPCFAVVRTTSEQPLPATACLWPSGRSRYL